MNINPIQSFNYSPATMRNNQLQKVNSKPTFKAHIDTSIKHYDELGAKIRSIKLDSIKEKLENLRFKLEITRGAKARSALEEQIEDLELDLQYKLDKIKELWAERDEIFNLNGWGEE